MSITITVDVPNFGSYTEQQFKKKVTDYAISLLRSSDDSTAQKKKYKHEALCGLLAGVSHDRDLRDEYLKEKYDL